MSNDQGTRSITQNYRRYVTPDNAASKGENKMKILITQMILFALSITIMSPALTAYGQDAKRQTKPVAEATVQNDDQAVPPEVLAFSQQVASVLKLEADGSVSTIDTKNVGFSREQQSIVDKLVADINSGTIGIAIVDENRRSRVYGNEMALSTDITNANRIWADRQGVHLYLDEWWTNQLTIVNDWAVGVIIGMVVTALCGTGFGCVFAGGVAGFIWSVIITQILRRYYPRSIQIDFPVWGYTKVKLFGGRYNGRIITTGFWT